MTKASELPPLMGNDNRRYLAACFGSRDGTVAGVADKFERARLRARIRFQERFVALWRREWFAYYGSADGSLEKLPPANRDAALLEINHSHADVQAECREVLKRPALLRAERDELIDPFFGVEGHD